MRRLKAGKNVGGRQHLGVLGSSEDSSFVTLVLSIGFSVPVCEKMDFVLYVMYCFLI